MRVSDLATAGLSVCLVASEGASLEAIAAAELAQLESFGEILASGPELSYVELPAGRAARLDLGLSLPDSSAPTTTGSASPRVSNSLLREAGEVTAP